MTVRMRSLLPLALLLAGVAAFAWSRMDGARSVSCEGVIEPETVPVVSLMGGTLAEILAHPGEHVTAGQLLVRFESSELDSRLARVHSALRIVPEHLVEDAASLLERLPPDTVARVMRTDPQRIAAEQEYLDALAQLEANRSEASQKRLHRAENRRRQAYQRAGELRSGGLQALGKLQGEGLHTLHWMDAQRDRLEIRAPADGVVEILDLKAGDVVAPLSKVALLDLGGKFMVEARLPEHREKDVKPGMKIEIAFSAGNRVHGVVESVDSRELRVRVVNPPVAPKPGESVQVLF